MRATDITQTQELQPLLSIGDVARHFNVPEETIRQWRYKGYGPQAIRIGRHLRWHLEDVLAFTNAPRDGSAA